MAKKMKTSIALDMDLISWIDDQVKTRKYASRSHCIEYAITKLKES
jgi:Arc/MetJ-type ribon-helix-helix transcriptional regulator